MKKLDSEQFVGLLPTVQHRVRGFISAIMPRFDEVDEVLQSTLVIAWKKLGDFTYSDAQPDDEFVRWLCAIARFEALALARKRGDDRLVFTDRVLDQIVEMQVATSETWDQQRSALRHCVDKLNSRDRDLVSSFYDGVPATTLAESSGKTRQSIYKLLSRIRRDLQSCIQLRLRTEGA